DILRRTLGNEEHEFDPQDLSALLEKHEIESRQAVDSLHQLARDARVTLLNVTEYQALLDKQGSTNSDILVIGEIAFAQDSIRVENVVGPGNIKSRLNRVTQTVTSAPNIPQDIKTELAALLSELDQELEALKDIREEDSQRVLQSAEMLAAEVAKQKPNKS